MLNPISRGIARPRYGNREIAADRVINEKTVEGRRANLRGKLGTHDRVEVTRDVIRRSFGEL